MSPGKFPDLVLIDLTSSFRLLYSFIKHSLPHVHTSVSFRLVIPYTSSYPVFITVMTLGISITDRSGEEDMPLGWSVGCFLLGQSKVVKSCDTTLCHLHKGHLCSFTQTLHRYKGQHQQWMMAPGRSQRQQRATTWELQQTSSSCKPTLENKVGPSQFI